MVKFVNKLTGSDMWVADERVEEYKEAGHKLASDSSDAKAHEEKTEQVEEVKKKTPKKK